MARTELPSIPKYTEGIPKDIQGVRAAVGANAKNGQARHAQSMYLFQEVKEIKEAKAVKETKEGKSPTRPQI